MACVFPSSAKLPTKHLTPQPVVPNATSQQPSNRPYCCSVLETEVADLCFLVRSKEDVDMENWLSIAMGLGLAAACGFRVFVPLLVMSLAARSGHMQLASSFDWVASTPALIAFGSATALEVGAYYIPWLDNLLDGLTTPTAVVAGMMATGSQVADMDPWMSWTLSVVGGGGMAGGVQALTVLTRQVSSFATAGFGNPFVSTLEAGAAVGFTLLSIVVPFVAVLTILILAFFLTKTVLGRRKAPAG